MHQSRNGTEDTLRVIHQPNQFPQGGFAAKVYDPIEFWMVMTVLSHLDKLDFPSQTIHNFLIARSVPPFYCHIVLPPRCYNPKRNIFSGRFMHLGKPSLLLLGKMDVALEKRGPNGNPELLIQELDKSM